MWIGQQEFTENNIRHWPRRLPEQYKELAVETWFRRNDVIHHPNGNDVFRVKAGLNKMQTIAEGDVSRKSFKGCTDGATHQLRHMEIMKCICTHTKYEDLALQKLWLYNRYLHGFLCRQR